MPPATLFCIFNEQNELTLNYISITREDMQESIEFNRALEKQLKNYFAKSENNVQKRWEFSQTYITQFIRELNAQKRLVSPFYRSKEQNTHIVLLAGHVLTGNKLSCFTYVSFKVPAC